MGQAMLPHDELSLYFHCTYIFLAVSPISVAPLNINESLHVDHQQYMLTGLRLPTQSHMSPRILH